MLRELLTLIALALFIAVLLLWAGLLGEPQPTKSDVINSRIMLAMQWETKDWP